MELIAVSLDDSRMQYKVKPYLNGKSWTYRIALDASGISKKSLRSTTIPMTVIIGKDNNIAYQ